MLALTSPVRTRAHDWPAGPKLAALSAACIALFAIQALTVQLAAFATLWSLALAPGRRFAVTLLRRIRPLWPFVAILLIWNGIDGQPRAGIVLSLRLVTAMGLATLVTMTTRLADILDTLDRAARPLRRLGLSTRPLEIAMALVIRFVPTLMRHAATLGQSWRSRSHRRPGWRIVAPLAILALDDADRVADALRARGGLEGPPENGT